MYLRKTFKDWFQDSFDLVSSMTEKGTLQHNPVPEAEAETPVAKAKAKARGQKRNAIENGEETPSAKKPQSGTGVFFKKLMKLRNDMAIAVSTAREIETAMEKDPKWRTLSGEASADFRQAFKLIGSLHTSCETGDIGDG